MRRLLWGRHARADIDRIAAFYAPIEPGLPERLIDRIEKGPLLLLERPHVGTPIGRGLRKWPVRHTPFLLLYVAIPDAIQIRRVRHAASDWMLLE